MIASGFRIHLCCDCCPTTGLVSRAEFHDETPAVAWRLARHTGWGFKLRGNKPHLARCPTCAGLGRPFPKTAEDIPLPARKPT